MVRDSANGQSRLCIAKSDNSKDGAKVIKRGDFQKMRGGVMDVCVVADQR